MARLFNREVSIQVGTVLIRSRVDAQSQVQPLLSVSFRVERSRLKEPNKAEVTLRNLNEQNRAAVQSKRVAVVIEAGHVDNTFQLFSGELEFGSNRLDGTDWLTHLQAGDGTTAFKSSRINTSIKGPAPLTSVVERLSSALKDAGLGLGNLPEKTSSSRGSLIEFAKGIVLSGKTEKVFSEVMKAMGFSWSIQDGKIQVLEPNETIGDTVAFLSPSTGLIGSPDAGEDGIVKARALLTPNAEPGRRVSVESATVEGFFRVEKAIYTGDTWGNDWYADLELKPL